MGYEFMVILTEALLSIAPLNTKVWAETADVGSCVLRNSAFRTQSRLRTSDLYLMAR